MKRLAILVSFSGEGGVERVIKVLAGELCKHLEVDLLTLRFEGGHARDLPPINPLKNGKLYFQMKLLLLLY